ncbi:MAG: hypothetical protein ACK55I_16185, partial [bacterium]
MLVGHHQTFGTDDETRPRSRTGLEADLGVAETSLGNDAHDGRAGVLLARDGPGCRGRGTGGIRGIA